MFDIFATGQAARMLVQRDPAPGDRLDAFLFLAGQEYLWRTDGPGPDFGEGRLHLRDRHRQDPTEARVAPRLRRRQAPPRGTPPRGLGLVRRTFYRLDIQPRSRPSLRQDLASRRRPSDRPGTLARSGVQGASPLARRCRAPRDRARPRQCRRSLDRGQHRERRAMNRAIHRAPAQALHDALSALAKLSIWIAWTADPDLYPDDRVSAPQHARRGGSAPQGGRTSRCRRRRRGRRPGRTASLPIANLPYTGLSAQGDSLEVPEFLRRV